MNTFTWRYWLLTILLCGLMTACGFQLRGAVSLPPGVEPIAIQSASPGDSLSTELRIMLSAYDIDLATAAEEASFRLVISEQERDRRTAALDQNARAVEYQLIETVVFELRDSEGKTVLGPNKLTERRIMPNDPNRVVSSGEEETLLRREMQRNLAGKIARQLSSFDYNQSATSNTTP